MTTTTTPREFVIASSELSEAANASVLAATIVILMSAGIVRPTGPGEGVLIILLTVRIGFLASRPRRATERVTTTVRVLVGFASLFFMVAWAALGRGFGPFDHFGEWSALGMLALAALIVVGRSWSNVAFVKLCLSISFITFVSTEWWGWGLILGVLTAATAHLGFHARLRGDAPTERRDRNGIAVAGALMMLIALAVVILWPRFNFDWFGDGDEGGFSGDQIDQGFGLPGEGLPGGDGQPASEGLLVDEQSGTLSDAAVELVDPIEGGEVLPAGGSSPDGQGRVEPQHRDESSRKLPWTLLQILLLLLAGIMIGWMLWRRSQVSWIDRTVKRFDRLGIEYKCRLGTGQTLNNFATSLDARARPLAMAIATRLDTFSFAQDPSAQIQLQVEADLGSLRTLSRKHRKQRWQANMRRLNPLRWVERS